ncbi:hypothetical protein [Virgibacillus necropolis]|uniref:hypothetical protein n=1 Tax=Virgibacillus necropolis TaxID=163877 RepID=UPI0029C78158|nr:hypothetical protein [Virgibacillus necropolis]
MEELQRQNISSMIVLVLEDNSSRFFYEPIGGKKLDSIEVEISGKKLNELVYGWGNIRTILQKQNRNLCY